MKKLIFLIFTLLSCSQDNLPKVYTLDRLRVLALIADQPEANAGTTITVTPVVSFPNRGELTFTQSAVVCTDPGVAYGSEPTCTGASDAVTLIESQAVVLTSASGTEALGSANQLIFDIPSNFLENKTNIIDLMNGVPYLLVYTLNSSDGQKAVATKKILVTSSIYKPLKNNNPIVAEIHVNDVTASTRPSKDAALKPIITAGSNETITYFDLKTGQGETRVETLTTTWFMSEGKTSATRTENDAGTLFTPSDAPAAFTHVIVAITRDETGGTAFTKFEYSP